MGDVDGPSVPTGRRTLLPRWDARRRAVRPATARATPTDRPAGVPESAGPEPRQTAAYRERDWRASPLRWVVTALGIVWITPTVVVLVMVAGSASGGVYGVLLLVFLLGLIGYHADRWSRTATRIVLRADGVMEVRARRHVVHTTVTGVHGIVRASASGPRDTGWALQTSGGTIRLASDLVTPDLIRVLRRANPDVDLPDALRHR